MRDANAPGPSRGMVRRQAVAIQTGSSGAGTRALLGAVRWGTADEAEAVVRANWLNGATRLLAALHHCDARGGWVPPSAPG